MCKKIIILLSIIGLVIIVLSMAVILFNTVPYLLSWDNINFTSPFEDRTPSQFVFLTCMVTSTLTLSVIGNRLRDRRDALYNLANVSQNKNWRNKNWKIEFAKMPDNSEPKYPPTIKQRINNCTDALDQINIIEWIQLAITLLTSFRILLNSLSLKCELIGFIDAVLVAGAFIVFGILWPLYFFAYGGGGKPFFLPQYWARYWKERPR